jgi:hypothetical protein
MQQITEMASIQEMRDKTETQVKSIKEMLDNGYYDYNEANLFGTGTLQQQQGVPRLGQEDAAKIYNTIKNAPLKEFFAKSGTTGIMGAAYLIPTKLYQTLYDAAWATDITAQISMEVLGPDQLPGATQNVSIIAKDKTTVHDAFRTLKYSTGGEIPSSALTIKQATLDFTQPFGMRFDIARDLIEDSQWDIVEQHLKQAGGAVGETATNLALAVLAVATDGDGTLNTGNAGANTTTLANVVTAYRGNIADRFVSDTFITSPECWMDAIVTDTTYTPYAMDWHNTAVKQPSVNSAGSGSGGLQLFGMNVIFNLTTGTQSTAATPVCTSYAIQKASSLLTGRKRWMRIENFSDPRRDLVGATVTCRQDSVTIYNDSIFKLSET